MEALIRDAHRRTHLQVAPHPGKAEVLTAEAESIIFIHVKRHRVAVPHIAYSSPCGKRLVGIRLRFCEVEGVVERYVEEAETRRRTPVIEQ